MKDNEEIYVRAEKDYNEYIKHNFSQRIQNNKDFLVLGSYTESIAKYHKQAILGLKDVRVGAEYLANVALSKDTIIGLISYLKCRCR
ncbi:bacteriophage T4 gp5 trimerisation domain-containing protein [Helicobacter bilis]|uniref:bacteriophage T4 gp5 trimerisation domain-containing protein n=1 Tax=Helicobacter bilis TaxID=37372 RepID=UPI003F5BF575